jgi:threonine synthase
LLARYDLTAAKRVPRSALTGREASMWRYRELLPLLQSAKGLDAPITLGEGWTPLLRARRLGATLGLKRLYVKDEGRNPTGSLRARGMSAAVTRALHSGAKKLSAAGAGHTIGAAAAYGARAALETHIFPSKDARPAFAREALWHGGIMAEPQETLSEAERIAALQSAEHGWYNLSALSEPYRVEGKKTIGFELAEQLGWELPDWLICPVAAGTAFVGLAKATVEMASLGWIDPVRRPHMVAVQSAGCAPVVRAFGANAETTEPWTAVRTFADDLRVTDPAGGRLVLRSIRESSGLALAVGDVEILRDMKALSELEGISAAPGGGAALQAVRVLTAEGRIKPHDTVVIINPAGGFPYLDLAQ